MSHPYIEVTDQSFKKDVLDAELPVIVDFWAAWCGPCRAMAPAFESLAEEYKGKVIFAKMDTDANMETPSRYGIQGIPTLILFKGGKPVEELVGLRPRAAVKQAIDQTFALV
ncbi:MAG TPA: thioredoxin [Ktedonobacterales bacterium]|nr:thioredoxin [Ktedonobacterales bacterium]